ncbi:hypothetical protein B0T16DRAFT_414753 [Cercophora newfieldiana]|uniref:Uncharacterized protein n=1 Tax=Cercophora newfieldiana TaxID=92897 RepID=A0AA40CRV2_9PEZI|nr:hypothetical protein B0T16DRAFT_414753 [Cercophora newfieldiana]
MSFWSLVNDPCILFIRDWISDHIDEVIFAYNLRGGWELWLQVELATAMASKWREYHPIIEREVQIRPASKKRCDILVRIPEQFRIYKSTSALIELKCESVKNTAEIVREMKADRDKIIEAYGDPAHWAIGVLSADTVLYSIGICVGDEGQRRVREFTTLAENRGQYEREAVPYTVGGVRREVEIWYKKLSIAPLYPARV